MEKIGLVTAESLKKNTGKSWEEWNEILDKVGARHWKHSELTAFVKKKYKLTMWWQHSVAAGYEIFTGKRMPGRTLKGTYSITVTKTFPISSDKLWKLLTSDQGIAAWLRPLAKFKIKAKSTFETESGAFGEVRTMQEGRRVRMTWQEIDWQKSSIIQIYIIPRTKDKSIIAFQHEGLYDGRLKEPLREQWKTSLNDLLSIAQTMVQKK